MSRLVTRPPVPVPGTLAGSTPCSPAMRATTGEMNALPFAGESTGAGAARSGWPAAAAGSRATGCAAGSGGAGGAASGSGPGSEGGGATAVPVSPPMRASTVPTSTVSPSVTRISLTMPEAGDGTSVSTLSVEISSRVSSASIVLADLLEPPRDRALRDGDAHLGHHDVDCGSRRHVRFS